MKILILNPPSKYAKNVVRDLFYGCWCKGKRIASTEFPPTTLLSVYSVLKSPDYEITLLDTEAEKLELTKTLEKIKKMSPDIVILPTSTMSFNEDVFILQEIKKSTSCKTILFGSQVSFFPKESLQFEPVDFIVIKEPEFIIKHLVESIFKKTDIAKIDGIGFKKENETIINKPKQFIHNLDELPISDRSLILQYSYFNPLVKYVEWTTALTSRGCVGHCNFCTSPSFYGDRYRYNSPKRVIEEIEYLIGLGYKEIFFRDETFTGDYERTEEICNLIIQKGIKISWICSSRVDTVDEKLIRLMKKAGCHMIRLGIESGSQKILNNLKKGTTLKQAVNIFKICKRTKMEIHAHIMLGCPGETWETVHKTISFVKQLGPTSVTCGAFTPYPGTKIFEYVKKQDKNIGSGTSSTLQCLQDKGYFSKNICDLTDEEVGKAVRLFYRQFYFRPSFVLKTLLRIKSFNELRRIISAGLSVFSYSIDKNA